MNRAITFALPQSIQLLFSILPGKNQSGIDLLQDRFVWGPNRRYRNLRSSNIKTGFFSSNIRGHNYTACVTYHKQVLWGWPRACPPTARWCAYGQSGVSAQHIFFFLPLGFLSELLTVSVADGNYFAVFKGYITGQMELWFCVHNSGNFHAFNYFTFSSFY
jgi:hypothetical protein